MKVPKKEIFSWALFDFANSTFSTVVMTAIFTSYFVKSVAAKTPGVGEELGTFLLTIAITVSSLAIVVSAPVIGSLADATANKKKFLAIATGLCIVFTALLATATPGNVVLPLVLIVLAGICYGTGEDLIAAFLPEIANREDMGRVSAFGWTVGYIGGLMSLAICLAYVKYAEKLGQTAVEYVPVTMLITAALFAFGSLPTFLFLKERAVPQEKLGQENHIKVAFERLKETIEHAKHYRDLAHFLITLFVLSCGTTTVVSLAAVYAQQVMKFSAADSIKMILVVNITAAIGAFLFGFIQDKLGSVKTLAITLFIWASATTLAFFAQSAEVFWIVANLVGLAMGSSQSAGRALVGQFSPEGRSAEFFGLWGLVIKAATAVGPLTFGTITYLTSGNYRAAIISTTCFFVIALVLLFGVNEKRGIEAAHAKV